MVARRRFATVLACLWLRCARLLWVEGSAGCIGSSAYDLHHMQSGLEAKQKLVAAQHHLEMWSLGSHIRLLALGDW